MSTWKRALGYLFSGVSMAIGLDIRACRCFRTLLKSYRVAVVHYGILRRRLGRALFTAHSCKYIMIRVVKSVVSWAFVSG